MVVTSLSVLNHGMCVCIHVYICTYILTCIHTQTAGFQPLIASISGGSSLTFSIANPITLSAANSVDPDVPATSPQGLTFSWTCEHYDGLRDSPCRDVNSQLVAFTETADITLPAGTLEPSSDPYVFIVSARKGARKAQFSMPVTVVSALIPSVAMRADGMMIQRADGTLYVNSDQKLAFFGYSDTASTSFQWLLDPPRDLSSPAVAPFGTTASTFVLQDSSLVPGTRYTITLRGTSNNNVGESTSQLLVNTPPFGGSFAACLTGSGLTTVGTCIKRGLPMVDTFRLLADGWTDSDGPAMYQFGWYQIASNVSNGTSTSWFEASFAAYRDIELPSGRIVLLLRVYDMYSAVSPTLQDAVVVGDDVVQGGGRRLLATSAELFNRAKAKMADNLKTSRCVCVCVRARVRVCVCVCVQSEDFHVRFLAGWLSDCISTHTTCPHTCSFFDIFVRCSANRVNLLAASMSVEANKRLSRSEAIALKAQLMSAMRYVCMHACNICFYFEKDQSASLC